MRNYYENKFRFLTFGNDRISNVRTSKMFLDHLDHLAPPLAPPLKYPFYNDYFNRGARWSRLWSSGETRLDKQENGERRKNVLSAQLHKLDHLAPRTTKTPNAWGFRRGV